MKMSLEVFIEKLISWATTNGIRLAIGVVVLFIGWKVIKKIVKRLSNILNKRGFDSTLHSFLEAFVDMSLKIILIICVLNYVGIGTSSLAALVASAGLAVGLALQGSLSNFAGGVIILMMRPFQVGDFIEAAGYSGTVERIKIFYTHLATPDNKEIMIPNGTLANGSLINYSAKDTRRVDLTFGVGYDADILHVKRTLSEIVESCEFALKDPAPFISLSEHGASSVNFVVRVWSKTENYWNVYFYLLEQAKLRFDEEKISIPYPQMDIHIKEEK
ncbi:mechanosensitive ion channel family protein [Clostridium paraputrificum]|uniref:mechanosensitive ion channel family protein n=1 Tax=Clostridium TaxID=1485 RepID=UPI003D348AF7